MSGKEALNLPRRLEPLHDPLSSSGRLMGVFGPIIEALVLPATHTGGCGCCTGLGNTSTSSKWKCLPAKVSFASVQALSTISTVS